MTMNRGAAFGRLLCVSIVLYIVVVAVGFASLSALPGTASSGLPLRLRTSAPCVSAKVDVAAGPRPLVFPYICARLHHVSNAKADVAAGPLDDTDADDS